MSFNQIKVGLEDKASILPPYPIEQRNEEDRRLLSHVPTSVAVRLLAASLYSFHLVLLSILDGHPVLHNVPVVPHFLHLMTTVFTAFHDIFISLEFFFVAFT